MSIDLSQFKTVFFEESYEGLEQMESLLLNLNDQDDEALNAIFRAAHSIKGGAGMFGYNHVVDFTHVAETLLDEMRSGKRAITSELVQLFLQANDSIKTLLDLAHDDINDTPPEVTKVQQQLQLLLDSDTATPEKDTETESPSMTAVLETIEQADNNGPIGWKIVFRPIAEMLKTGNEPLHMLSALQELGEMRCICHTEEVPVIDQLSPTDCYLSWTILLKTEESKDEIEEIFAWVEDLCELSIDPLFDDEFALPHEKTETNTHPTEESIEPEVKATAITSTNATDTSSQNEDDRRKGDRRKSSDRRQSLDRRGSGETNSLRVGIEKIDTLINRVGELVITQSMLSQISHVDESNQLNLERLLEGLAQLERNTREIQEDVMQIRMLPISFVFNRFPRLVHDLQAQLGKQIELVITGQETELDKTLMEKISDPLVHLVRNSIDHGIELPADRLATGKPETGKVELNAFHQGGSIIIEIIDDGKGLNQEKILEKAIESGLVSKDEELEEQQIFNLIMQPGFSTADKVTDLSGRGVGMDVVARNIAELGGSVQIESTEGKGSCFRISLPLTLAILDGQQAQIDGHIYIIPLMSIVESLQVPAQKINAIGGQDPLYSFRGEYIPLINLRDAMGHPPKEQASNLIIVVEANNQLYGLIVDELLGQQQFVIKSLEENYQRVEGVAGATILGSGQVGLIIDIAGIFKVHRKKNLKRIA